MSPRLHALIDQLTAKGDFPAVGRFLAEVGSALRMPNASAQQIANLILKDVALTATVLRTVNSAFFAGASDRRVSTISHAVILLGVDTVANLAVGLRLLDHFRDDDAVKPVRTLILDGMLTGLHAREVSQNVAGVVPEEAFIAGLLHDLGRLSVAYHIPDAYGRITTRVRSGGDADEAAVAELGATFAEIGSAVASAWNFPAHIRSVLASTPDSDRPASPLQLVVSVARALTTAVATADPTTRRACVASVRDRYQDVLPVRTAHLERAVEASSQRMKELLAVLRVKSRDLTDAHTLPLRPPTPVPPSPAEEHPETAVALVRALQEITEAMGRQYALNDVVLMILEAMLRGLAFDRVIFLLVTPQRDALRGRLMLGPEADGILPTVHLPIDDGAVAPVIGAHRDVLLPTPEACGMLPDDFRTRLQPSTAAILPIVVNGTAIGAFYADRRAAGTTISSTDVRHLRLLRDQAVLAVRLCRTP